MEMYAPRYAIAAERGIGDPASRLGDPRVRDPMRYIVMMYLWPDGESFHLPLIHRGHFICFNTANTHMHVGARRLLLQYRSSYTHTYPHPALLCGTGSRGAARLLAADGNKLYEACLDDADIRGDRCAYKDKMYLCYQDEDPDDYYFISDGIRDGWCRPLVYGDRPAANYYFEYADLYPGFHLASNHPQRFARNPNPVRQCPIAPGDNPYRYKGIWYNLSSAGIWSRHFAASPRNDYSDYSISPSRGTKKQYLVGPDTWEDV